MLKFGYQTINPYLYLYMLTDPHAGLVNYVTPAWGQLGGGGGVWCGVQLWPRA